MALKPSRAVHLWFLIVSVISASSDEDPTRRIVEEFSGYPTDPPRSISPLSSLNLSVDTGGLQIQIDELAAFSDTPAPSVTRILYTENDVKARRYIKILMGQAGLSVHEDAVGNIFGRWKGYEKELEAVSTGSHIDAIPYSGKYDGVVGVLGAIEAINVLKRSGFKPKRSLDVILFTSEEPTRFGISCLGSRLLAGSEALANALNETVDGQSISFFDAAKSAGYAMHQEDLLNVFMKKGGYSAFIELHIEQGPILEEEGISIGVVTAIAAPASIKVEFEGNGGHAGAVLMPARNDAGLAAAELALAVEKHVLESGSIDTVGTVGIMELHPGAINSIPSKSHIEIDTRDIDEKRRNTVIDKIHQSANEIATKRGVQLSEFSIVNQDPPALSDKSIIDAMEFAVKQLKLREVLTASEKQIAYHTCVALRQYYRSHLILLVDSLRPNKSNRSVARSTPSARAAYKPLDISNEAMDAVFLQIQRDRKLGPAFVRAPWPAVEKFLVLNGHLTLLELSQAPPVERYLHDLAQYALGVLHIVTFVPHSRKFIVNATLSNDRVGMAVILDAANGAGYADPEVIHSALNVLVNLVCPPPSISNKPSVSAQGQQSTVPNHTPNGRTAESRERHSERIISDRTVLLPSQNEPREHNLVERTAHSTPFSGSGPQPAMPATPSGVVGDRRITLGTGPGCAGLATQLEQGYRQAREAVRANNGIKVLLHLLQPRMITPPATLDCIRALACRVLLGLARDDTIAHILTKLQVGKKLSELIRDSGSQASGTEQEKWQSQLAQVAIELIAIVTNSERASTLAATDATAPTLRRIERAAIASATPITYHSRELLLLIQEHLQLSGLTATATLLQKEAELTPLPLSGAPPPPPHRTSVQETSFVQMEWPSGRSTCGFLSNRSKTVLRDESSLTSSRVKLPVFSSKISDSLKNQSSPFGGPEPQSLSIPRAQINAEPPPKTPISLPLKRKFVELKDQYSASPAKRQATTEVSFQSLVCQTPTSGRRNLLPLDGIRSDDFQYQTIPGATPTTQLASDHPGNTERMTLDSLVVQYLKNQHRHCSAPITTLPPLSLLHPHVCPEPSHSLNAPVNVTARVSTREFRKEYGGIHSHRRDRQFVYSRFKPSRTCRDDGALLSCLTFLGSSSRIATGCHSGELKLFDTNSGNVLESHSWHQSPVTLVQSAFSGDTQMVLSSGTSDVRLWDASVVSGGPLHLFEGCKAARFSHSGTMFAAIGTEVSPREVLLYDIQTYNVLLRLPESSNGNSGQLRGHSHSVIHFSPLDTMLLWSGILWDRRSSGPVHRFDQFTDYGGGGFHPAGNEVIINSEVWDLRKFKLLRSVPSLDQTVITFNAGGDIIYAILRRNLDDITSAVNTRRVRNPLFPAFRTIDATTYSDIATVPVDRCVLDFAADPTDSFVGVVTMDDNEDMFSSARLYEIGRRRPTDDDSDPDDGADTEEDDDDDEDDDNDSEAELDPILGADLDSALGSDSSNQDDGDDDSGDGDFNVDDLDFDGGQGLAEFMGEGEDDEDSEMESFSSEEDEEFDRFGF